MKPMWNSKTYTCRGAGPGRGGRQHVIHLHGEPSVCEVNGTHDVEDWTHMRPAAPGGGAVGAGEGAGERSGGVQPQRGGGRSVRPSE